MSRNYLGVDIGGTFIKLGIVDDAGNVSMRREVPIDRSGSKTVMETLMQGIDDLLADSGFGADAFEGIGVSAAGCINTTKGCVAENGGNVPNWSFTSVTGPLTERYGIGATIANDGNCVALAEAWIGAAQGIRDVICVVLGTGVGGGIISGGHLIEGSHGFGGEIGHFPTHADLLMTGEKKWGSHYETFASTGALVRRALTSGKDWLNGKEIFEAASSGDADALGILDGWTTEIAAGITGLVHIFDPAVVLIGGGVSAQEELLVKPVRAKVLETVTPDMAAELQVKAAALGNSAGMVGAVKYFIDRTGGGSAL